ncbi:hypothetical protein KJS94_11420 [Flavihumibacter rivuli]|uniref:PKD domain-containing protein n=1 Tax=Flavihumibacter rivuli TaxID=2838156 RepID=UPI001BDE5932|nr:hypothetical protein [Flavihumibacter rivuli]ULQ55251.1 hypothetical protein KJS94_11420 [Flavihumibacter rivuli]
MKKYFSSLLIVVLATCFVGCEKDPITPPKNPDPISAPDPVPPVTGNSDSKVGAGGLLYVILPNNETFLSGSYSEWVPTKKTFKWKKIAGPDSYQLASQNEMSTQLTNLVAGIYQFEFSVYDYLGLYGKDTATVVVNSLSAKPQELQFANQTWIFPWYNSIEIKGFFDIVSLDKVFKVLIKRDNSDAWIDVPFYSPNPTTTNYDFFVETRVN